MISLILLVMLIFVMLLVLVVVLSVLTIIPSWLVLVTFVTVDFIIFRNIINKRK